MMKTLYVTGYKPFELNIFKNNQPEVKYIKLFLMDRIKRYVEEGLEWVMIQGNLGIELWAAEAVLRLKKEYDIKLAVIPPFLNHFERWNDENKMYYEQIVSKADYVNCIHQAPYGGPYMFKNAEQFILDHTEGTLMVYDDEVEGTPRYFKNRVIDFSEQNAYNMDIVTLLDLSDFVSEYMREKESE